MASISIPGLSATVDGEYPLVIIGPNGVGKTQLGVALARQNSAERVAALRNVEIGGIPMQTLRQASQEVKNALDAVAGSHWRQSYELQNLLSEILAEDREQAVAYRTADLESPSAPKDPTLSNTRLRRIAKIWNRHFPGRTLKIDYEPVVARKMPDGSEVSYSIAQMSEGERTALYLAARVISCKSNILILDEPETFFHPVLAKNLWDDFEREAENIRFVYITHDIPFALSRRGARFAVARPGNCADLLPETSTIPGEVVAEVLGAASFSISASRLIFCEGKADSLDLPILRSWHNCPQTAIVPVGSCNSVRECVSVFKVGQITSGLSVFGYLDRDAWPDSYLSNDENVKAHFVSEIEGIFCVQEVFFALARHNGIADVHAAFNAFIAEAKGLFEGVLLNKEILQRAKLRVEVEQRALLNPIKPNPDLDQLKSDFCNVMPPGGWSSYMQVVFNEEQARLSTSLVGEHSDFFRDFPAKSYFKLAAKHMEFLPDKMVATFCKALELSDAEASSEKSLAELRDAIVPFLDKFLWPRSI